MTRPRQVIRTVLGDLDPQGLGRTNYHEHLIQITPLLSGDELDDVARAATETGLLRDSGFDALVDLTPIGLGRDPDALATVAAETKVQVVGATGVHREAHYATDHPVRGLDETQLIDVFVAEIDAGMYPSPFTSRAQHTVRAGTIKVGIGYWSISPFEERALAAAGQASQRTGASVVCHLELGSAAWEAADRLEAAGADRERIVLAHADRNPDPGLHRDLIESGVTLGYDGAGRTKYWPDSVLLDCLAAVVDAGAGAGILLGGDVARRSSFEAYGGMPGMAYLGRRFVPRIAERCGEETVQQILVDTPARVFAMTADRPG